MCVFVWMNCVRLKSRCMYLCGMGEKESETLMCLRETERERERERERRLDRA